MKEGTLILYFGNERTVYKNCSGIGLTEHILMFSDRGNVRHATNLPYEVIYETN